MCYSYERSSWGATVLRAFWRTIFVAALAWLILSPAGPAAAAAAESPPVSRALAS